MPAAPIAGWMNFRWSIASRRTSRNGCARSGNCEKLAYGSIVIATCSAVTRGLDPRVHPLRRKVEGPLRKSLIVLAPMLALLGLAGPAGAQDFFRGKTVNVI